MPTRDILTRIDSLLERADSVRPSCMECVNKHIGSAFVLMGEVERGYPDHKILAIGHLSEAEDESQQMYPELAALIREVRQQYQSLGVTPNFYDLMEQVNAIVYGDDEDEPVDEDDLEEQSMLYPYTPRWTMDSARMDRQTCKAGVSQPCGDVCIPMRRNGKPVKCGTEKNRLGFKAKSAFEGLRSRLSTKERNLAQQAAATRAKKKQLENRAKWEQRRQEGSARSTPQQATQQRTKTKTDPWKSQDYSTRKGANPNYNESADKELLGVKDIDARTLSRAYKSAARQHHPDVGGSTEKMQRVNQAYENLKKKYKLDSRLDSAIGVESGMYWVRMDAVKPGTRAGMTLCTPGKTIPCGKVCRTPPNCKKGGKGRAALTKEAIQEYATAKRAARKLRSGYDLSIRGFAGKPATTQTVKQLVFEQIKKPLSQKEGNTLYWKMLENQHSTSDRSKVIQKEREEYANQFRQQAETLRLEAIHLQDGREKAKLSKDIAALNQSENKWRHASDTDFSKQITKSAQLWTKKINNYISSGDHDLQEIAGYMIATIKTGLGREDLTGSYKKANEHLKEVIQKLNTKT